jgi:hypothetical protein
MKNCPICHRQYSDQVQYCTRDGTRLMLAVNFNNHCSLCNKFYPPGEEVCPVHGTGFGDAEQSAIGKPPEEEYPAPAQEPDFGEQQIESYMESQIEEPPAVVSVPEAINNIEPPVQPEWQPPPAAHTRQLSPPPIPTVELNTMMQYSSVEYASADRKLVGIMALVFTLAICGLVAYGLSRPSKQVRVSKQVSSTTDRSTPDEDQIAQVKEEEKEEGKEKENELIQQIELDKGQQIPEPVKQTVVAKQPVAGSNSTVSTASTTKQPRPDIGSRIKGQEQDKRKKDKLSAKNSATHVVGRLSLPKTPISLPKSDRSGSLKAGEIANNRSNNSPSTNSIGNSTGNSAGKSTEKRDDSPKPPLPVRVEPPRVDEAVAIKPKAKRIRSPKVIAQVFNKSRVQTPNGYIYQFDLVLRELSGLNVTWRSVNSRKVSYSGRSTPVNSLSSEQSPDSSARYRVVVKMTGTCIEDWYGQLITVSSGVDENGNPVEIEHVLLLDDSFPEFSRNLSRSRGY